MLIRSRQQFQALASPVRQEIVDALEAAGPLSVSQLAALLGRATTALYSHIQTLHKAGLVTPVTNTQSHTETGVVYDLVGRPLRLDYDSPAGRAPVVKIVSAALRVSQREFSRACTQGARAHGADRLVWGGRARGWLTNDELRELNDLLARAQSLLRKASPRQHTTAVSLGFLLSPVQATGTHIAASGRNKRTSKRRKVDS